MADWQSFTQRLRGAFGADRHAAQRELEARSRELEASNRELAREMVMREYMQQELQASNERLNHLLHELKQHNDSVTRLNLLSDQLHCCDNRAELLKVLERSCAELFACAGGALLEWREQKLEAIGAPWGAAAGRVWRLSGEPLLTLRRGAILRQGGNDGGSRGEICVPLQSRGENVGVLVLVHLEPLWRGEPVADTKLEQMLRGLADHTALALNNLALREQLREQSLSDPLTGLYNRRYMYEQLDQMIALWQRHEQPFALILLDVDFFKQFNDRYGHDVGDAVLIGVADAMRYQVRRSDVACRMGGEEFVVLMAGATQTLALQRADSIRRAIARLHADGRCAAPITISAGVALFPDHAEDAYLLLRAADRALYRSKAEGRDRITLAARCAEDGNENRAAGRAE